jgi:hypothetical protein
MRKRKLFGMCGITFLVLAGGLAGLGAVAKHEPSFYRQSQVPPCKARKELADTFVSNFTQMLLYRGRKETWGFDATEAQINSFFAEILMQHGEAEGLHSLGISSPGVILEEAPKDGAGNPIPGGHLRLAFRYGSGWFSTIISYEMRIWLVPKEANVIAVEVQRARAGGLPISNQTILYQLADYARKQNYKVNLFRHEGSSVAIIDLQGDQQQPKNLLTMLNVGPSTLSIRGRTLDHALPPLDPSKDVKKLVPTP